MSVEKDRSVGEHAGLPIDVVRSRLDVYVVVLRESGLPAIERVGGQWFADKNPLAPDRGSLATSIHRKRCIEANSVTWSVRFDAQVIARILLRPRQCKPQMQLLLLTAGVL